LTATREMSHGPSVPVSGTRPLLRGDYAPARSLFLQAIDASPGFYEPVVEPRLLSSVEKRQAPARESP
jgi:hypothetical protein